MPRVVRDGGQLTIINADYKTVPCPADAAVLFTDPPYALRKNYGGEREANKPFERYVADVLSWSAHVPWTFILAPLPTMAKWLPRIPPPTRILWWCKTFAQIRKCSTWQHAVTPILVYATDEATFYFPGGTVPDWIACASSMADIRVTKKVFRGVHPGVTGTPIVIEVLRGVARPGDLIVDPFAGIGSVLIAARRLGCRAWGCEIVPEYAEAAAAWGEIECPA